jgi:hypothetical protein
MNFRRLLSSAIGRVFISILLGLGLATLFRKVCTDKNCIVFNGPVLADVEGKIFKVDDKCYTYTSTTQKCDSSKKVVEISKQDPEAGVTTPAPSQKSMFGVF